MPNFSLKHRHGTLNRGHTHHTHSHTEEGVRLEKQEVHTIFGGDVRLYRRERSTKWQCATYLNGREWRKSTGEESLTHAKDVAEDWYLDLHGKKRVGELKTGKTFAEAARKFEQEYEAITTGRRSPKWVQGHKDRIRLHLNPFFGKKLVAGINSGAVQDYRVHRMTKPESVVEVERKAAAEGLEIDPWKPPAQKTLHNEIVTLSMVLKSAKAHEWIESMPDLSDPYRRRTKVEHRPWFTPKEYKQLYEATRLNAKNPKQEVLRWYAEQLHDYVLFMANTGLRPDEAILQEFRDVEIVYDDFSGEKILEIEVRGKRGVGYCKSMPGAVRPFERLRDRLRPPPRNSQNGHGTELKQPESTDRLFPNHFLKMFNRVMTDAGLKFDRHGKARTRYSLRHTYICLRLLEGADIYQVAKNCRTSVEMIEKHYAAHLKDMIDTSLVNVRKPKMNGKKPTSPEKPEK